MQFLIPITYYIRYTSYKGIIYLSTDTNIKKPPVVTVSVW